MKFLRIAFYVLIAANVLILALGQGWFGGRGGGEPERLKAQLAPEKIKIASVGSPPASGGNGPTVSNAAAPAEACRAVAGLTRDSAQRLADHWRSADADLKPAVRLLDEPTSFWVFIPPLPDRSQTDRRVAELRSLGISDLLIIREGPLRNAISLGVFKNEEGASEHLARLERRGVTGAQVGPRTSPEARAALEVRGPEAKLGALQLPPGSAAWASCTGNGAP